MYLFIFIVQFFIAVIAPPIILGDLVVGIGLSQIQPETTSFHCQINIHLASLCHNESSSP